MEKKYSFKTDRASVEFVINNLSDQKRNLNEWENNYIISIKRHYITEHKSLSERQYEVLSKIWEKY